MKAANNCSSSCLGDELDSNVSQTSSALRKTAISRRTVVTWEKRMKPHRFLLLTTSFVLVLSGCRLSPTTSEAFATKDFSPVTSSRTNKPFIPDDKAKFGITSRGGASIYDVTTTERSVSSRHSVQALHEEAAEGDSNSKMKGTSFQKATIKTEKTIRQNMKENLIPSDASVNQMFLPVEDDYATETAEAAMKAPDNIPCDYIAETNLPTDIGHFRLRAYRVSDSSILQRFKHFGAEPCVIYSTDKPPFGDNGGRGTIGEGLYSGKDVPVRVHDQCFTSEVFRSQRCDCKEQLKMSLEFIQKNGGCIIYLQQEGRGIGLANKVAAYAMQDVGLDTVDANTHLGFPEDARMYGVIPSILADLEIESIKLMTNNPRKVDRLSKIGVNVKGTIPMVVPKANAHNKKYLQTKQDRMNHRNFGEMLSASTIFTSPLAPNGLQIPPKISVAEKRINDGEEMAASAVVMALTEEEEAGVTANADGYCFGRQSVEDAIVAVGRGEIVVVVDDMNRENEGDFIMAADLATPETIATIVRYSSGVICIGMEGDRMDELELPSMVKTNEDPKGTAFSVTVDAHSKHGITTGISAKERSKTLRLLASSETTAGDFCRPGHIFPLRAKEGGVLTRDGHTEAAVDLSRLAGRHPSGVLCEIVSEEHPSEMARLPELKRLCKKHGWVLTSIVDIAQYRRDTEKN